MILSQEELEGAFDYVEIGVRKLAETDPSEAWKLSDTNRRWRSGSNMLETSIHDAIIKLSKESPRKALEALYPLSIESDTILKDVSQRWVSQMPHEAAEWVTSLPEGAGSADLQRSVFEAWSKQSPQETAVFMNENGLTSRVDLTEKLTSEWVLQDTVAALAWAEQLNEEVREVVLSGALESGAKVDPISVRNYINEVADADVQQWHKCGSRTSSE